MKNVQSLFVVVAGLVICAVAALNAEAAGRRVDPNAVDKVPSPFHGTVVNVTASTITVKGSVKAKGWQPASGEPRPAPGQQAKETSVSHTINFSFKPDVTVKHDGKASQLKDIKVGDSVSVTFTTKEGSSLKHVTEIATGAIADPEDQPKGDKKGKKKQQ